MKSADQILKTLRLTEKATNLSATVNQYTFEVFDDADRISIRHAVEKTFKVDVTRVNLMRYKSRIVRNLRTGKMNRKRGFKKAIVTLKAGEKIEII